MMSTGDPYQNALSQLLDYGLEVQELDTAGKLQRVRHRDDKPGKRDGWYIAREFRTKSGDTVVHGSYGWWKDEGKHKIKISSRGLTEEERKEFAKNRRHAEQLAKKARTEKAAEAALRAKKIFSGLPNEGSSSYLRRKKISNHGGRFAKNDAFVIPVHKSNGQITGLQFIAADGSKKFLSGTDKKGAYHLIGQPEPGGIIFIAEGYATAASVHQAVAWPGAVAFDAGNLAPVASALRGVYPKCRFVVCGDDDRGTKGNPGRTKAEAAAQSIGATAVFPQFDGEAGSDFNDLHCAANLKTVRNQLLSAVATAPTEDDTDDLSAFDLGVLLREFVLIYGTETVFDGRLCQILNISALRVAAGKNVVQAWLEHPDRRMVRQQDVVFDPTETADTQRTVNLFSGFKVKPIPGKCDRLLALLYFLCNESDSVFDWALKWFAYPLQHPGAKMQTALVIHGPEGTGKNILVGAVSAIYEEYGAQIGQMEIESSFNGWLSRKLFIICNEITTRSEVYHQKGRIKALITEPALAINEKMLPVRFESNHCNFVFLSNTIQPVTPDQDDRRYMVIWTPPAQEKNVYEDVAREIEGGGVSALYDYLLNYDLEDFNEHAKPIETAAKNSLIEASVESHVRFYNQWQRNQLPIRFAPCKSEDLFAAYTDWCKRLGERSPAREAVFSSSIEKREGIKRSRPAYLDGTNLVQHTCFIPSDWQPPDGGILRTSLGPLIKEFQSDLANWRKAGL